MKLVIGNDHAATEMKFQMMAYLEQKGISFTVWCFDPHWAPTLITDWNFTLSTQGRFFKAYLQQKAAQTEK